jgi:hypothetical protein
VRAPVLDRASLAVDETDEDLLAEQRHGLCRLVLELAAEERRVPVIAEPDLGFEVGARRFLRTLTAGFHRSGS